MWTLFQRKRKTIVVELGDRLVITVEGGGVKANLVLTELNFDATRGTTAIFVSHDRLLTLPK